MNIKRYEPIEVVGPDGDDVAMECRPDGEYYSRADLIAAGVLVPVPDGEACRLEALYDEERIVRHDGKIYFGDNDGSSYAALADTKPDFPYFDDDTIVQPVRLVRLEDVG